jgi:hypothetical protein
MLVQVANIVRTALPGKILNFRVITLKEPLKKDMISYLEREHTAGDLSTRPPREARVQIVLREAGRNQLHELVVNIDLATVIERKHLEGKHPCIDSEYMNQVEAACRADSCVQAQIKTLHLPAGATVVIEPWAYATDGTNDMTSERTTMCWFYMRLSENADANYYAYPLDICAEVSEMLQVTKVYRLPVSLIASIILIYVLPHAQQRNLYRWYNLTVFLSRSLAIILPGRSGQCESASTTAKVSPSTTSDTTAAVSSTAYPSPRCLSLTAIHVPHLPAKPLLIWATMEQA